MAKQTMTMEQLEAYLDELERLPRFDLSPDEAAPVLGCDANSLSMGARDGNPVAGSMWYFTGRNMRISKAWVLAFAGRRTGAR